jgi:hypothetical protein
MTCAGDKDCNGIVGGVSLEGEYVKNISISFCVTVAGLTIPKFPVAILITIF